MSGSVIGALIPSQSGPPPGEAYMLVVPSKKNADIVIMEGGKNEVALDIIGGKIFQILQ